MLQKNKYIAIVGSLVAVVWLVLPSFRHNAEIPADCSIENKAIGHTEKIVYKAYYNWQFVWIPAGEAEFQLKKVGNDLHIKVTGRTYEAYDPFFKVRDYFYSVIDAETMYPKSFVRIVQEGDYRKFDSLSFKQEDRLAISYNGRTRSTATRKTIQLEECTHDLLSVLYFMRNINVEKYKTGDYVPTRILFDEKIYPIKVRYAGKEADTEISDLGSCNTVKVIPDLITGNVFKDGNKMSIWVSDDGNKLPLLIESPLSVGSAKAILSRWSGLRHPFSRSDK